MVDLRLLSGCVIEKRSTIRHCGYVVRVLGRIQHVYLNATRKEENQTKPSFHPCFNTQTHLNALSGKHISACGLGLHQSSVHVTTFDCVFCTSSILINAHALFSCLSNFCDALFFLLCTFSDLHISTVACQGSVDLSNQLHVVEQRVEAIKIGEADLMRCAASCNLSKERESGDCINTHVSRYNT